MIMRYRVLGDDATLDRIDEIVPPGTDLYRASLWRPPVLAHPAARRRPPGDRAAAQPADRLDAFPRPRRGREIG
jgi:hypothetical protein